MLPRTALIIGASSPTGMLLVKRLRKAGIEVHGTIKSQEEAKQVKQCGCVACECVDLTNLDALRNEKILLDQKGHPFDVVFYCASAHKYALGDDEQKKCLEDVIDRDACICIADLCAQVHDKTRKCPRFVHLCPIHHKNLDNQELDETTAHWVHCCAKADSHIKSLSDRLVYTVIRSGFISDSDAPTGRIELYENEHAPREKRSITRQDLVECLFRIIQLDKTKGKFYEIVNGNQSIDDVFNMLSQSHA